MSHECPAPGCDRPVPVERLACAMHWRMVPRNVQREVWTAYKYGSPEQHRRAVARAVDSLRAAVENRERQLAQAAAGRAARVSS